jgi:hypothetical protein
MTMIYVPGRGNVSLRAGSIDRALHQYDERLFFSQHPETGQWTVFVKIERDLGPEVGTVVDGQRGYPIFAFPHGQDVDSLTADTIMQRVYAADTLRHGEKMLDELHAHNERIKQKHRDAAAEAEEVYAEAVESYVRGHESGDIKFGKVYMNGSNGRNTAIRTG